MTGYRKPDRITNPQAVGSEVDEAIYRALRSVDQVANDMEMKWGIDRIEQLVTPDMGMQFGIAKAQLDQAIDERNPQLVAQKGAAMIRGWKALDKAAEEAGHFIISQQVEAGSWRHPETGQPIVIVRDTAQAGTITRIDKISTIYTLDEVCRILHSQTLVNAVKDQFPGSVITEVRQPLLDVDEVPF